MKMMPTLNVTTCLAVNTVVFMQELTRYLQTELGLATAYVDEDAGWAAHIARVGAGKIHLAWLCGWPYVRINDRQAGDLEIVAAPVLQAPRYERQPVYFADMVVSTTSAYDTMASLNGAVWAYNDPGSLSGWLSVAHHLACNPGVEAGNPDHFFGRVVESGAHAASLELLVSGQVDCAAIDSTLLDYWRQSNPALADQIRVLHTLGPFPIPPLVIHRRVSSKVRQHIRHLLLEMHHTPAGRQILAAVNLSHFARCEDADYDAVRQMQTVVETAY